MNTIASSGRGDRSSEETAVITTKPRLPLVVYEGKRHGNVVSVFAFDASDDGTLQNPRPVPLYRNLRDHSPSGFEWGYGGSGPSQLALALCAEALADHERALRVYQHFKWQHVATFPRAGWRLTNEQIVYDVEQLEAMS